ncbi:MAG: hypothetical protein JSR45_10930 [Proteobacteria bacterium]|nr:hypothetical protein [Pseudomonadota bacterium]
MPRLLSRLLVLGLVTAALAGCDTHASRKATIAAEMDGWAEHGEYGGLFTEFRRGFPADYAALKTEISDGYADGEKEEALKHKAFVRLRGFSAAHAGDVARAPTSNLVELAAFQREAVHALSQENTQACADFSMSAIRENTKLSPKVLEIMNRGSAVQLRAARAGIDHPTDHPTFGRDEARELITALGKKGVTIPANVEALPVAQQCHMGVVLYDVVRDMPPEHTAAFIAAATVRAAKAMDKPI